MLPPASSSSGTSPCSSSSPGTSCSSSSSSNVQLAGTRKDQQRRRTKILVRRRRKSLLLTFVKYTCLIAALFSLAFRTFPHLLQGATSGGGRPHILFSVIGGDSTTTSSLCSFSPTSKNLTSIQSPSTLDQPSSCGGGGKQEQQQQQQYYTLKRNWNYGKDELHSPIAKLLEKHQTNCSLPVATDYIDNNYGMGSHLYVWSQALCNAMEDGYRLQSYNPNWLWMDQTYCDTSPAAQQQQKSPLLCYFPMAESLCEKDNNNISMTVAVNVTDPRNVNKRCALVKQDLDAYRAAAMEYLFRSVSPLVIQEAQRQLQLLFSKDGNGQGHVPDDLITVHARWGDKFWEMDLPSEYEYVNAVCRLLLLPTNNNNTTSSSSTLKISNTHIDIESCNLTVANIYLASEDPRAVQAFQRAAPKGWNIYVDRTVIELDAYRPKKGNRASWTTRNTKGRAGLVALGSLLVAMESNDFVLTTKSNWSRLMNELRKNVINPRCSNNNNCTRVIDLRPGSW